MCEFLVRAVPKNELTLQRYKDLIKDKWIPEANAYSYNKADLDGAYLDVKRLSLYRFLKNNGLHRIRTNCMSLNQEKKW